jgi:acylphosphatase
MARRRRVEAIVSGRVQTVGFRDRVQEVALRLGVAGEVANLPDRTVKVVAEAEPATLEAFFEEIARPHGFIAVRETRRTREGPPRGLKPPFRIKRGPMVDELGERLDQGVVYLQAMHKDLVAESRSVGAKVDQVGEGLGQKIDAMREDMNVNFRDLRERYGSIERIAAAMLEEMSRQRQDFREALERASQQHTEALRELKDAIRERRT